METAVPVLRLHPQATFFLPAWMPWPAAETSATNSRRTPEHPRVGGENGGPAYGDGVGYGKPALAGRTPS